jgi:hypothetical protein
MHRAMHAVLCKLYMIASRNDIAILDSPKKRVTEHDEELISQR